MILITIDQATRLDLFLAKRYQSISRRSWKLFINQGLVRSGGRKTEASAQVSIGDLIEISEAVFEPRVLIPNPNLADLIEIVGTFEGLVLVNKPPLMPCHPLEQHETQTLANALCHLYPQFAVPGSLQGCLLNRIDTETSGLVIAAENPDAFVRYQEQFQNAPPLKTYLCLLDMTVNEIEPIKKGESFITDWPIAHDQKSAHRVVAVGSRFGRAYRGSPRPAETRWQVIELDEGLALMRAQITKGQFHQIRAHAHALGTPVLGDKVYGVKNNSMNKYPHHLLHAAKTSIGTRDFYAALPPYFARELSQRNWQIGDF